MKSKQNLDDFIKKGLEDFHTQDLPEGASWENFEKALSQSGNKPAWVHRVGMPTLMALSLAVTIGFVLRGDKGVETQVSAALKANTVSNSTAYNKVLEAKAQVKSGPINGSGATTQLTEEHNPNLSLSWKEANVFSNNNPVNAGESRLSRSHKTSSLVALDKTKGASKSHQVQVSTNSLLNGQAEKSNFQGSLSNLALHQSNVSKALASNSNISGLDGSKVPESTLDNTDNNTVIANPSLPNLKSIWLYQATTGQENRINVYTFGSTAQSISQHFDKFYNGISATYTSDKLKGFAFGAYHLSASSPSVINSQTGLTVGRELYKTKTGSLRGGAALVRRARVIRVEELLNTSPPTAPLYLQKQTYQRQSFGLDASLLYTSAKFQIGIAADNITSSREKAIDGSPSIKEMRGFISLHQALSPTLVLTPWVEFSQRGPITELQGLVSLTYKNKYSFGGGYLGIEPTTGHGTITMASRVALGRHFNANLSYGYKVPANGLPHGTSNVNAGLGFTLP